MRISTKQARALGIDLPASPRPKRRRSVAVPEPISAEAKYLGPGSWCLELKGWTPPSVNRLLGAHWSKRSKMKREVAGLLKWAALFVIPDAKGKRLVSIEVNVPNMSHAPDADNVLKAMLDGCKTAGLIVDDKPKWLALGPVTVQKGARLTRIWIEELP